MNSQYNKSHEKSFMAYIATVLLVACASAAGAEESPVTAELALSPNQCIALHQGQKCYVDIEVSWVAQRQADYCLFSSQQQRPLMCWSDKATGSFKQEVIALKNVSFRLRQTGREKILGSGELEMAWVYKKNSRARSSWRMF